MVGSGFSYTSCSTLPTSETFSTFPVTRSFTIFFLVSEETFFSALCFLFKIYIIMVILISFIVFVHENNFMKINNMSCTIVGLNIYF